jgi:hypothetical protein
LTVPTIEIKDFARRVERLCDFFISKATEETGRNGSEDLKVLEDLKNTAADIQFDRVTVMTQGIEGLSEYMNGA